MRRGANPENVQPMPVPGETKRKASITKASQHRRDSMQASGSDQVVVMKGYLDKLSSGTIKRYQSRYFELAGHYLSYYATSGTVQTLKGSIDLTMLQTVEVNNKDLVMRMKDARQATLRARSNVNAEQWREEIQNVIARCKEDKAKNRSTAAATAAATTTAAPAPAPAAKVSPQAQMDRLKAAGRGNEGLSKVQKVAQAKVKSMIAAEGKRREGLVDKGDLSILMKADSAEKAEVLLCQKLRALVQGTAAAVEIKEADEVDLELEEADEDEDGGEGGAAASLLQLVSRVLMSVRCVDTLSLQGCGLGPSEFAALGPMLTSLLTPEAIDSNKALNARNAINKAVGMASPSPSPSPSPGAADKDRLLSRSLHTLDLSYNNVGGWNGEYGDKGGWNDMFNQRMEFDRSGLQALVDAISAGSAEGRSTLRSITLTETQLDDEGMTILCELIPQLPRLQFLGLKENPGLGVAGAEQIAKTLLRPRTTVLEAPRSSIVDDDFDDEEGDAAGGSGSNGAGDSGGGGAGGGGGASGLCIAVGSGVIPVQAIQEGKLRDLMFAGKELGSFGAALIGAFLAVAPPGTSRLVRIDLSSNAILDRNKQKPGRLRGLQAILAALGNGRCPQLTSLDLCDNNIDAQPTGLLVQMTELAFAYVGSAFEKKDASASSKAQASAALQSLQLLNKLPLGRLLRPITDDDDDDDDALGVEASSSSSGSSSSEGGKGGEGVAIVSGDKQNLNIDLRKCKLGLCEAMLLGYWLKRSPTMQARLRRIDLRDNNIGDNDEGGAGLAASVELHGGQIAALDGIEISSTTTSIDLGGRAEGLSLTAVAFIAAKLRASTAIGSVDLSGNYIAQYTTKGMEMLGRALEANKSVTRLDLSKNNLSEEAMIDLLTKIKRAKALPLKTLDLSDNGVGPHELKKATKLQKLSKELAKVRRMEVRLTAGGAAAGVDV